MPHFQTTFLEGRRSRGRDCGSAWCAAFCRARLSHRLGDAGKIGRQGHAPRIRYGNFRRQEQQQLGQEEFSGWLRYAYDRGIRFFETSESYGESQQMLGVALKGRCRATATIDDQGDDDERQGDPLKKLDELRKNSDTEYFDIMLLHCADQPTWPSDSARWQDAILEAQSRRRL
jgi:predicted aldo/keto reductase-like oxidoreductase